MISLFTCLIGREGNILHNSPSQYSFAQFYLVIKINVEVGPTSEYGLMATALPGAPAERAARTKSPPWVQALVPLSNLGGPRVLTVCSTHDVTVKACGLVHPAGS